MEYYGGGGHICVLIDVTWRGMKSRYVRLNYLMYLCSCYFGGKSCSLLVTLEVKPSEYATLNTSGKAFDQVSQNDLRTENYGR